MCERPGFLIYGCVRKPLLHNHKSENLCCHWLQKLNYLICYTFVSDLQTKSPPLFCIGLMIMLICGWQMHTLYKVLRAQSAQAI